ncbi:nucleoside transporter C-terminal domain-containing protein [Desulfobacterales bacterium HSG16]|nr:nucleoside transporter C-terminal domain-containing protein [Desulfobacterales bacterium HSG16]
MIIQSVLGLFVFAGIAWLLSEKKTSVNPKFVIIGILLQLFIGALLLKIPQFRYVFRILNEAILFLDKATTAGTTFVFGYLGGGLPPFDMTSPQYSFIIAFKALPLVLVISAISSLLFYWKVLPLVVRGFSWALQKTMNIGGAEGVGLSANIFIGMVEAPVLIRPYLKNMTRSEIFTIMSCGMATIAGTVMAVYATFLMDKFPDIMGHILTASVISVPAAIVISKIMIPETNEQTDGTLSYPEPASGPMDAVTKGTIQGVDLLINIVAMLIVLVALVHLINSIIAVFFPDIAGSPLTLERIFGFLMAPIVWLMGIPADQSLAAGSLMGTKTVLNEFIAYLNLSQIPEGVLSERSTLIMTYALCGFANPGSLGIMIGGLGTMIPERRSEIVALGFRSIIAGTLATCMTGAVVGILY